jgi:hypothetical protein
VKAPHINEDNRYLLAIMRRSLTRIQSKYSAGGREKRRSRPTPGDGPGEIPMFLPVRITSGGSGVDALGSLRLRVKGTPT